MKAIINKKEMKITLDNEAVKAIRFVKGFDTNLRVSLKGINKDCLWWWLADNGHEIFGIDFLDIKKNATDADWDRYERMLNDVVRQVIR